ncbi:hypothetical protein K493DRAFT_406721 [Basidiobolus meristosporus CBS 931.73]|uniref:25S rRNA (uridine-N(3))-methyltransferase BMT5-like domain-containing protein n=1 Tax=Basidiobolus meristosporus CBS 931.73 TaxID=1314790 RepID=A0A1Y1YJ94_9FUNG|nr:hypothetical protein K493DRAFT_406721 [Basidiobolus meristosporus CBS 931.73]|eukprot:ORX98055.1 hypothetical protein K493DRAFT_406721 [Basidiobolus meristosporus CBS 931.73]
MPKPAKKKLKAALGRFIDKKAQTDKLLKHENLESKRKEKPKKSVNIQAVPFPFSIEDTILLIGEGNFSFARALGNLLGTGSSIIATCLDSEEVLKTKYDDAEKLMAEFKEAGGVVLFEVDGTKLDKLKEIKGKRFTRIVFNFPHAGAGIKDQDRNIRVNQVLMRDFFASAVGYLTSRQSGDPVDGEIHVALKTGKPYDLWNLKELAKSSRLITKTSFPFLPEKYPGYEHRRTLGFKEGLSVGDNEEITSKNPRTYVFSFPPPDEEDVKKKKRSAELADENNDNNIRKSYRRR